MLPDDRRMPDTAINLTALASYSKYPVMSLIVGFVSVESTNGSIK